MEMSLGSRLKHAWNVFKANEIIKPRWDIGPSYHYRPDRPIFSRGNERSIITSVYNRIALDVAAITIQHVRLDDEGRFSMYHSITFDFGEKNKKNTWDDWHLVSTSRPVFNPPAQKVKTIDIPGGDGVIDLSQALTGYPVFQNRTGSFEFIVPNGFEPWEAGKIEQTG